MMKLRGVDRSVDTQLKEKIPPKNVLPLSSSSVPLSLDETASNASLSSSSISLSSTASSSSNSPISSTSTPTKSSPVGSPSSSSSLSLSKSESKSISISNLTATTSRHSQILLAILSLNRDQVVWEDMEDDLYILLDGNLDRLLICKEFYFQSDLPPRKKCALLKSISYLLSNKADDMSMHDEHISRVASFLSMGRDSRHLKLEVLNTLNMCLLTPSVLLSSSSLSSSSSSIPATTNDPERNSDVVAESMFNFLTARNKEWDICSEYYQSAAMTLVYELRAKCLRELDLERERIRRVVDNGENTAVLIATGAKLVEFGIQKSNKAIEGQISNAGNKMKNWIDVDDDQHRVVDHRDAIIVRAFSGSTKRASEYVRKSTKLAAQKTMDATLSGLYTIGNKFEEGGLAEKLSPESREIIKAAGRVGMASVGAIVLVSEAVMETGRSVSAKTAEVTVDVVGHKYGTAAGEVVKDAADTCTNVWETIGNISLVGSGSNLVKTAAGDVGKKQIDEDVEKAKKMIVKLERQGSIIARQTLGIEWKGNWTKELCASKNPNQDNVDGTLQQRDVMAITMAKSPVTKSTLISTDIKSDGSRKSIEIKQQSSSIENYSSSTKHDTPVSLRRSLSMDAILWSKQRNETNKKRMSLK